MPAVADKDADPKNMEAVEIPLATASLSLCPTWIKAHAPGPLGNPDTDRVVHAFSADVPAPAPEPSAGQMPAPTLFRGLAGTSTMQFV